MAFLAFRSFVGEYRSDLLDAGLPNTAFYGFFLVLVIVLTLVQLVRVRGGWRTAGGGDWSSGARGVCGRGTGYPWRFR